MSIHPNGSGTGWTNVETVDVDQPHGKDYLYSQHIAKGVRKRSNKQHVAFGDSTAGGEHLPGGCSILDIVDQTIDISIDDSTYVGRNLIYDQTNSVFWCFTNTDYTGSTPAAYKLMMGPKSICLGGDFTWTGSHDFSDVDISGSLDLAGALACGSTATITNVLTCSSKAVFSSDVSISGDADVTTPTTDPQIANKKYVDDKRRNYARLSYTVSANTDGGTATSGSWIIRPINTEDNDSAGIAALASNQIVLSAGDYECRIKAIFGSDGPAGVNACLIRLRNVTGGSTLLVGMRGTATNSNINVSGESTIAGAFTVAASQTLEIQYRVATTSATTGLGDALNFGENEVYLVAEFWKIN